MDANPWEPSKLLGYVKMTPATTNTHIEVRSSKGRVVNQFSDVKLFHNWVHRQSMSNPSLMKTLSFHKVTIIKKDEPIECPPVTRS